jgi:glycine cleavage system transcriptional repressor
MEIGGRPTQRHYLRIEFFNRFSDQWRSSMDKRYIMTAFSKDRPGIVADLTEVIYENGGNLEDSSMTSMLDEFVIILLFTGKEEVFDERLSSDCRRLEREKGITAFVRPVEPSEKKPEGRVYKKIINAEGVDQAGIVYKVSRFLADRNINIEHLSSHRVISPESGTAIYTMAIKVQIPDEIVLGELEAGLSTVGEELNLDISVE